MKKEKQLKTKKDDIRLIVNFILLGLSLLTIILLLFKTTRSFIYGVFGYSIYVYIPSTVIYLVLSFTGWIKKFNSKNLILISLLILSIISTIHVATSKSIIKDSSLSYIMEPYFLANTPGGLMMSLLSYVFVAISRDYGFVLTCVFILMSIILLMTIYPLILMIGRGSKGDKKVCIKTNSMPSTENTKNNNYDNDEQILVYGNEFSGPEQESLAHQTLFNNSNTQQDNGKENLFGSLTSAEDVRAKANSESAKILFSNKDVEKTESTKETSFKILDNLEQEKVDGLSDERPRSGEDILFGNFSNESQINNNSFSFDVEEKPKDLNTLFGNGQENTSEDFEEKKQTKLSALEYIKKPYDEDEREEYIKTTLGIGNLSRNKNTSQYSNGSGNPSDTKKSGVLPNKNNNEFSVEQTSFYDLMNEDNNQNSANNKGLNTNSDTNKNGANNNKTFNNGSLEQTFTKNVNDNQTNVLNTDIIQNNLNDKENIEKLNQENKTSVEDENIKEPLWKKRLREKQEIETTQQMSLDEHLESIKEREKSEVAVEKPKERIIIKRKYSPPPISLLEKHDENFSTQPEDYEFRKARIEQTMAEFDVPATIIGAKQGPTFTRYELALGEGYKIAKLTQLTDNLKMRLEVRNMRLLAPIGGKNAFGLEIPNKKRLTVGLREIIESPRFSKQTNGIDLCFGMTNDGDKYIADLTKMPHMLVAGSSGSGKSVFLNALIVSILYKYSPEDVRMILIDPKRVELNKYKGIPHLLIPDTIKEYHEAVNALKMLVKEMVDRYKILEEASCANISEYNQRYPDKKMHKIVLVVDEMADLMMQNKDSTEFEESVVRIAQLARAAGIHMILATQRPVVEVITGLIKSNITARVAFTVTNGRDSSIILDETGAEELLGMGDMLFSSPSTGGLVRKQSANLRYQEKMSNCNYIRENNVAEFDEEITKKIAHNPSDDIVVEQTASERAEERKMQRLESDEELAIEVLKYFIMRGNGSISGAQTKFNIGYVKAKRIVEMLGERGYLGSETKGSTPRTVEITLEELEHLIETDTF